MPGTNCPWRGRVWFAHRVWRKGPGVCSSGYGSLRVAHQSPPKHSHTLSASGAPRASLVSLLLTFRSNAPSSEEPSLAAPWKASACPLPYSTHETVWFLQANEIATVTCYLPVSSVGRSAPGALGCCAQGHILRASNSARHERDAQQIFVERTNGSVLCKGARSPRTNSPATRNTFGAPDPEQLLLEPRERRGKAAEAGRPESRETTAQGKKEREETGGWEEGFQEEQGEAHSKGGSQLGVSAGGTFRK